MKGYLAWFFFLLIAALGVESISGLMLIPTTLDMKFALDVPWRMMGELQLNVIAIHSLSAYLLMCVIGALAPIHMRSGLRQKKHLVHGIGLLAMFVCLMLSALGLLYLADDSLVNVTAVAHLITGLAVMLIFTCHFYFTRKSKTKKNPDCIRAIG